MRVGDLLLSVDDPTENDAVSGLVFLLNHTAFYIRDFQYNVQGESECDFYQSVLHVIYPLMCSMCVVFLDVALGNTTWTLVLVPFGTTDL